jgi:hypothetical protein
MNALFQPLRRAGAGAAFAALLVISALFMSPACQQGGGNERHPDEAEIRTFLERYFSTWSAQDMVGYGACFHPQARVFFLTADGGVVSQGLTDFLHGQRLAHERAEVPMTEHPVEMKIHGDKRGSQALVTWVLKKGTKEERGTDLFTLQKDASGWRIVSLAFYGEDS